MKLLSAALVLNAVSSFAPPTLRNIHHGVKSSNVMNSRLFSTLERPSSSSVASSVIQPNGMENAWEVHKFGGGAFP
jgi:hypothetical protein